MFYDLIFSTFTSMGKFAMSQKSIKLRIYVTCVINSKKENHNSQKVRFETS